MSETTDIREFLLRIMEEEIKRVGVGSGKDYFNRKVGISLQSDEEALLSVVEDTDDPIALMFCQRNKSATDKVDERIVEKTGSILVLGALVLTERTSDSLLERLQGCGNELVKVLAERRIHYRLVKKLG